MTRTSGAPIGCQRPSRFWGLGCPKIYHEAEDTLATIQKDGISILIGGHRMTCTMRRQPERWPESGKHLLHCPIIGVHFSTGSVLLR
ncbi:hypothetical protein, partial [Thiolapillus sp.]